MDLINSNIKYLRGLIGLTQSAFAEELGIKRATLGAYEEGRAKPKYEVLLSLSDYFKTPLESLIREELTGKSLDDLSSGMAQANDDQVPYTRKSSENGLRVLSITVDQKDRENIEMVPAKAAASYLAGFADTDFIKELPKFHLPFLPNGTYRAFEIEGDSMLPMESGSIVVGEYIQNWQEIKDGNTYVLISKDGLVYKRVMNDIGHSEKLTCHSDNPLYPMFEIPVEDLQEAWEVKAFISKEIPKPDKSVDKVMELMKEQQSEILDLRWELKKLKEKELN